MLFLEGAIIIKILQHKGSIGIEIYHLELAKRARVVNSKIDWA